MVAFRSLITVSAALLVGSVVAADSSILAAVEKSISLSEGLQSRQLSGVNNSDLPAACKSSCSKVLTITDCTDLKCICSNDMSSAIQSCYSCALAASDEIPASTYQSVANQYVSTCKNGGITVNTITVSKSNAGKGNGAFGVAPTFGLLGLSAAAVILA